MEMDDDIPVEPTLYDGVLNEVNEYAAQTDEMEKQRQASISPNGYAVSAIKSFDLDKIIESSH